jgi:hypothetical protein
VDVDHLVTGELYEQVLTHGPGADHDRAVEQRGGVGETALGARHARGMTPVRTFQIERQTVNVVSLRHVAPSQGDSLGGAADRAVRCDHDESGAGAAPRP